MKSGFLFVFVIAVLTHQAASVPGFGQCPLVTPVQNFDVANYLGHWYEIRSYRNVFEIGTSCVTADYGMNADGSISVVNRYKRFGQYWDVSGTATIPQAGQGALIVNFTGLQRNNRPNYIILGTDYNSYAVVYSCERSLFGFFNFRYAWILSRNPTLSAASDAEVQRVLSANGLSNWPFRETNQSNCA